MTAHPLRSERFTPEQIGEFLEAVYRNNAACGVSNAAFDPYAEAHALDRVSEAFPNASFEDIICVSNVIRDGNLGKDGIKAFWTRNGSGAPWDCGARSMLVGKQRMRFQAGLEIAGRVNGAEGRTRFSDGTFLDPEAQARLDALNQQQTTAPRIESWEELQEHLSGRLSAGSVELVEKSFQGVSDGVFQFGPLSGLHKEILRSVCRISCNSDKAIH